MSRYVARRSDFTGVDMGEGNPDEVSFVAYPANDAGFCRRNIDGLLTETLYRKITDDKGKESFVEFTLSDLVASGKREAIRGRKSGDNAS